jgi:hypothetical protein
MVPPMTTNIDHDDADVKSFRVFSRSLFAPALRYLEDYSGPVDIYCYGCKAQHTAARKTMLRFCRAKRMKLLSRVKDETDGSVAEMLTIYKISSVNFFWLKLAMSAEDDVTLVDENLDRMISGEKRHAFARRACFAASKEKNDKWLAQHQADHLAYAKHLKWNAALAARIAKIERMLPP